jgi:hypothetical protein
MPRPLLALLALAATAACTAVDSARLPARGSDLFVTTTDLREPYESLGVIQATHRGVLLFGHVPTAATNLQAVIDRTLVPRALALGADAVINLRVEQIQYTPAARIAGALFFFVPLPAETSVMGEAVRLRRRTAEARP